MGIYWLGGWRGGHSRLNKLRALRKKGLKIINIMSYYESKSVSKNFNWSTPTQCL